ncbi:MAG: transcriptional regulator [Methanobacteriota archaeon]|uniref:Membrane protein n=1 Tax=Candidatus Syntropharchaeum caldarium TaxID=1838285 RepID=A0A1F2P8N4_9EURY|nr:MAG: membrane protein [Candidatus Syntrophoarchaeum caldarius]RLG68035.1 MAG: transcriptional regulator [Euryarchaeota archaeon]
MLTELFILLALLVMIIVVYHVFKAVKQIVVNSIMGLLVLLAANILFGLNITYSWIVLLICAIGGIIGAAIVILLHQFIGIF